MTKISSWVGCVTIFTGSPTYVSYQTREPEFYPLLSIRVAFGSAPITGTAYDMSIQLPLKMACRKWTRWNHRHGYVIGTNCTVMLYLISFIVCIHGYAFSWKGYEHVQHRFHEMLNNLAATNSYGATYLINIPSNSGCNRIMGVYCTGTWRQA